MTVMEMRNALDRLPRQDQLLLAYWILEGAVREYPNAESTAEMNEKPKNPLLAVAGRFSGKPDNVSERAEDILMDAADKVSGFRIEE